MTDMMGELGEAWRVGRMSENVTCLALEHFLAHTLAFATWHVP